MKINGIKAYFKKNYLIKCNFKIKLKNLSLYKNKKIQYDKFEQVYIAPSLAFFKKQFVFFSLIRQLTSFEIFFYFEHNQNHLSQFQ